VNANVAQYVARTGPESRPSWVAASITVLVKAGPAMSEPGHRRQVV
jgi:hypothetical protein